MSLDNDPQVLTSSIVPGHKDQYMRWEDQVQAFLDQLPAGRSLFFIGPHPRDNCRVWAVTVKST